jgi:hypothetical protein
MEMDAVEEISAFHYRSDTWCDAFRFDSFRDEDTSVHTTTFCFLTPPIVMTFYRPKTSNFILLIIFSYILVGGNSWLSTVRLHRCLSSSSGSPAATSCSKSAPTTFHTAKEKNIHETDKTSEHDNSKKSQLKTTRKRRSWNESFQLLQEYQRKYGNCNVPYGYKPDTTLASWVVYQRQSRERLSIARREALNSLGFDWNPRATWNEQYSKLVVYKQSFGDCLVPQGYKPDLSLANWVSRQRKSRERLSVAQLNALNEIGFDWNPNETTWNEHYSKLVEYKQRFGDCNVPSRWKENLSLGVWVANQRNFRERVSQAQREALDSLGFDWDPLETAWNQHYSKLLAYKRKYGDCNVPSRWDQDPFLARWVHSQRVSRERLSQARREALNKIGFDWNSLETAWNEQYSKLVAYKRRHGDCNVPQRWEQDPSLGKWVRRQRHPKACRLVSQRKLLNEIGFDWDPLDTTWHEQYSKLLAYKQKFGDCLVPYKWKHDPSLVIWVHNQRRSKASLPETRRQALDDIGFDWDRSETVWNDNYQKLIAYKKSYGDCHVPVHWEEDPSLGAWVSAQRTYRKKGWLQLHRITMLEQLGFKWSIYDKTSESIKNEALWQSKFYGKLLPFVHTHGHCNVPRGYPADLVLRNWANHQRYLFSKGILRKDRMALLDGVGFVYSTGMGNVGIIPMRQQTGRILPTHIPLAAT